MKKEPKIKTLLGLNEESLLLDERGGPKNINNHGRTRKSNRQGTKAGQLAKKQATSKKGSNKEDNAEEKGLAVRNTSEVSKKGPEEKGLATIDKSKKGVPAKKGPENKKDSKEKKTPDEDIVDAEYTIQDDPDEENKDNNKGKEDGDKNNSTSLAPRKPTRGSTTISINWKGLIEAAWDKEPDKRQPQNLLKAVTNILKVGQAMKKYEEAKGANNA